MKFLSLRCSLFYSAGFFMWKIRDNLNIYMVFCDFCICLRFSSAYVASCFSFLYFFPFSFKLLFFIKEKFLSRVQLCRLIW